MEWNVMECNGMNGIKIMCNLTLLHIIYYILPDFILLPVVIRRRCHCHRRCRCIV